MTEDVATGYAARVHDPLWLLARQWQVGEFQGEDAGTPIVARWRARVAPMTRYVPGPIPPNTQLYAPRFDADAMPLESLVERQPLRQSALVDGVEGLRLAVESGPHFLRLLRLQPTTQDHSAAFLRAYPVPALTDEQRAASTPTPGPMLISWPVVRSTAASCVRLSATRQTHTWTRLCTSLPLDRAEVLRHPVPGCLVVQPVQPAGGGRRDVAAGPDGVLLLDVDPPR